MSRPAAFFDLDRTLVRVNSAALYVRWQVRTGQAPRVELARMAVWLTQYALGLLDAENLATRAARDLRGQDEGEFARRVRAWAVDELLPQVSTTARRTVARHTAENVLCAILTSSTPYSTLPVAEDLGIEHVLSSRLVVADGAFTGAFVRPLCYGPGKVSLAEAWAREHDVDLNRSTFYTDSISDLPMLERVGVPIAVNPDPRLRWAARRRGWRTEQWR